MYLLIWQQAGRQARFRWLPHWIVKQSGSTLASLQVLIKADRKLTPLISATTVERTRHFIDGGTRTRAKTDTKSQHIRWYIKGESSRVIENRTRLTDRISSCIQTGSTYSVSHNPYLLLFSRTLHVSIKPIIIIDSWWWWWSAWSKHVVFEKIQINRSCVRRSTSCYLCNSLCTNGRIASKWIVCLLTLF
jgi:hypothetical protein